MRYLLPFLFIFAFAVIFWLFISCFASFAYLDLKYFSVFEWHMGVRIFYAVLITAIIFSVVLSELDELKKRGII